MKLSFTQDQAFFGILFPEPAVLGFVFFKSVWQMYLRKKLFPMYKLYIISCLSKQTECVYLVYIYIFFQIFQFDTFSYGEICLPEKIFESKNLFRMRINAQKQAEKIA